MSDLKMTEISADEVPQPDKAFLRNQTYDKVIAVALAKPVGKGIKMTLPDAKQAQLMVTGLKNRRVEGLVVVLRQKVDVWVTRVASRAAGNGDAEDEENGN